MPYAIITGASKGIGRAVAEKFLAEGFSVAVCARNKEQLKLLEGEWNEKYPAASVIAYGADVTKKEEVAAFANIVLANFPQVDVLVNNAGIFMPGAVTEEPEGRLEQLMAVNLYSAYHFTRLIVPSMKSEKSGHIFNMCSVASLKAYPNGGSYGISKYALLGFSENLREDLKNHNIRVTALCAGATYTDSWKDSGIPAGRMMAPEDIAQTVWSAYQLSATANVETIVLRPIQGDV